MIPDKRVEQALGYLAETDEQYGQLRGHVSALDYQIKIAEAEAYLDAEGTVGEKQAQARTSQVYRDKVNEYKDAKIELETISAIRKRNELIIEVWRTQSASARRGNI